MNLWIRSQNREQLSKPNKLYVKILNEERYEILSGEGFYVLGNYKTKERALEVLDEIQAELILMPDEADLHGLKLEQLTDNIVYEMPKE